MKNQTLPTVPLTEDEKHHLQTVYGTRLRNLLSAYLVLVALGLYTSLRAFGPKVKYRQYDREIAGIVLTQEQSAMLVAAFIPAIIILTGVVFFFKRVYPYRRDLRLGVKEIVSYTIANKRYFEHTGQCFFSLNDPNYMHHEVDADTFHSMNEGDVVQVYRGVYSKHVFHRDGKFSFM